LPRGGPRRTADVTDLPALHGIPEQAEEALGVLAQRALAHRLGSRHRELLVNPLLEDRDVVALQDVGQTARSFRHQGLLGVRSIGDSLGRRRRDTASIRPRAMAETVEDEPARANRGDAEGPRKNSPGSVSGLPRERPQGWPEP